MAQRSTRTSGVSATILVALAVALCLWRERAPAARGADAPVVEVSAERAAEAWDSLPGAGVPHPLGSAAHAALADGLVERLRALGLDVRVEEALGAGRHGAVARTKNIVALLRGAGPADAPLLALSAHYDSVAAGSGASDAGLGCAALLETARALAARARSAQPLQHDMLFLLTDGEEIDLCGASDWIRRDPLVRRTGLLVNFEARGTQGLLRIFRVAGPQADLAAFMARAAPRPSTSSFAVEVFRLLPNDTDVTVHEAAGLSALDAACIGGVSRYHTPLDDAAHRDLATLQHACDTALALATRWQGEGGGPDSSSKLDSSAPSAETGEAGAAAWWSDILGFVVLRAPAWSAVPLALAALLLCLRRGAGRGSALLGAAGATLAAAVLAALLCAGGVAFLAWRHQSPTPWAAHPWTLRLAVGGSAFALGLWLVRAATPRTDGRPWVRTAGAALVWSLVALLLALWSAPAAPPLLLPALAAAAALAAWPRAGVLLAAPLAVLLLMPLLLGIEEAFGYGLVSALAVPWAMMGALLAGAAGRPTAVLAAGLGLAGWVAALLLPAHDADTPRARNVHAWADDGALWISERRNDSDQDQTGSPPGAPEWLPAGAWSPLVEGALADRLHAEPPLRVSTTNGSEWTVESGPGLAVWQVEASAGARVTEVYAGTDRLVVQSGAGPLRLQGDFGAGFVLVLDRPAPSLEVREARPLPAAVVGGLRPDGCVPIGLGDRLWRVTQGKF